MRIAIIKVDIPGFSLRLIPGQMEIFLPYISIVIMTEKHYREAWDDMGQKRMATEGFKDEPKETIERFRRTMEEAAKLREFCMCPKIGAEVHYSDLKIEACYLCPYRRKGLCIPQEGGGQHD